MAFEQAIKLPLKEKGNWLSHIEIHRDGDEVVIEVVNKNGVSYAESRISDIDFNNAADRILTRSSMEKTL